MMSGGKKAISKEKGVAICADMLYAGAKPKEVVRHFTETYTIGVSAVEKWMRAARAVVAERNAADEEIKARVRAEQTEEVARKLGISREWLLTTLKRVADLDIRKIFNEDGTMKKLSELDEETGRALASIEITEVKTADGRMGMNKKVKGDPRITAAVEIGKLVGYYPQQALKAKLEEEDAKGNKKSYSITLNL